MRAYVSNEEQSAMALNIFSIVRKQNMKSIVAISLYVVICNMCLYVLGRQYEQEQSIGLIIVGMVLIPIIILIYGGLPINVLSREAIKSNDSINQ
mgnify:CR=1 FL=1